MATIGLLISDLTRGGAERVVSRLAGILSSRHEVEVILFNAAVVEYEVPCPIVDLGIPYGTSLPGKLRTTARRIMKLRRLKRERGYDIVISFMDTPNTVNILAGGKGRTVVSVRNYISRERSSGLVFRLYGIVTRLLYNRADAVVAVSEALATDLARTYGIQERRIRVIVNPYDIEEIRDLASRSPEPEDEAFLRGHPVVCSMGRIVEQKAHWDLLKICSLVRGTVPDLRIVIVGDFKDTSLVSKLETLARELGLADALLMTGHRRNPFPYVRLSDCYFLSSRFEGFPNALVEAMACGVPVASVDCRSGPREILYRSSDPGLQATAVEHADFGIIVPEIDSPRPFDPQCIVDGHRRSAEAIASLLKGGEHHDRYAARSVERASEYGYARCGESFQTLIDGLTEPGGAGSAGGRG